MLDDFCPVNGKYSNKRYGRKREMEKGRRKEGEEKMGFQRRRITLLWPLKHKIEESRRDQ